MEVKQEEIEDDGFNDFLSEEDEEESKYSEYKVLQKRCNNVGFRDGIDYGKELDMQKGFDKGFAEGAKIGYSREILRGIASALQSSSLDKLQDKSDDSLKRRLDQFVSKLEGSFNKFDGESTDEEKLKIQQVYSSNKKECQEILACIGSTFPETTEFLQNHSTL